MEDFWLEMGWFKEVYDRTTDGRDRKLTQGEWQDECVRADAIRFLVENVLGKDPKDVTEEDFLSNKLGGLLRSYHWGSPHAALRSAGYEVEPWEMPVKPRRFYETPENRKAATRWLVHKTGKPPTTVTAADFYANRLGGLLSCHYGNSPYDALREAGYEMELWEMEGTPKGFFGIRENRIRATQWLAGKIGKEPQELTQQDFFAAGLKHLISGYHNGSPYEALHEAGLVDKGKEAYMRNPNHGKNPAKRAECFI
ncbi:MAG: hypothetical protein HYY37_05270 [Candidatus Aenigmarchaeota archaeon]|nr:hypothetical protein [Candidatus Aenigmarchaeota archaeon]